MASVRKTVQVEVKKNKLTELPNKHLEPDSLEETTGIPQHAIDRRFQELTQKGKHPLDEFILDLEEEGLRRKKETAERLPRVGTQPYGLLSEGAFEELTSVLRHADDVIVNTTQLKQLAHTLAFMSRDGFDPMARRVVHYIGDSLGGAFRVSQRIGENYADTLFAVMDDPLTGADLRNDVDVLLSARAQGRDAQKAMREYVMKGLMERNRK